MSTIEISGPLPTADVVDLSHKERELGANVCHLLTIRYTPLLVCYLDSMCSYNNEPTWSPIRA